MYHVLIYLCSSELGNKSRAEHTVRNSRDVMQALLYGTSTSNRAEAQPRSRVLSGLVHPLAHPPSPQLLLAQTRTDPASFYTLNVQHPEHHFVLLHPVQSQALPTHPRGTLRLLLHHHFSPFPPPHISTAIRFERTHGGRDNPTCNVSPSGPSCPCEMPRMHHLSCDNDISPRVNISG